MKTIGLLIISNIFMTFAWYGHLKYKDSVLWKAILVSWSIALFRILFPGSGQSPRIWPFQRRPAQDHQGEIH